MKNLTTSNTKYYLSIFEPTKDGYSSFIPNINGCISFGDTLQDAVMNMREALTLHISGIIEDDESIPQQDIELLSKEYKNEISMIISLDNFLLSKLSRVKQKKINISINEKILAMCDKKAKKLNVSRSVLIENSLMQLMD